MDDILCISHNLGIALGQIQAIFKFKGNKIEQYKIYLGYQVGKMIVDVAEGWYMYTENYFRAAMENIEQNLAKSNYRLTTRCKTPIMSGYHP